MNSDRHLEIPLILWGFALNLIWELAQSPLYSDHGVSWRHVAWTRFHCALGDVLILLSAFWAVAAMCGSSNWPASRGNGFAALFVVFGLLYTAWSEWFNTTLREAWAYAPAMPTVLGLGLTPLAQWLVVPTLLLWILRRGRPMTHRGSCSNEPATISTSTSFEAEQRDK